jgi:hypothetical protein
MKYLFLGRATWRHCVFTMESKWNTTNTTKYRTTTTKRGFTAK